jgi:hypothetical protein
VTSNPAMLSCLGLLTAIECHIFDLTRGQTEDASLDHRQKIVIGTLPEIQKLAVSPKGRTMACVLRDGKDERAPGAMFYAEIKELAKHLGSTGEHLKRPLVALDWPARDVVGLSISDTKDIHLVVRPELTARSREHKIPVVRVSLQQRTLGTLNIESRVITWSPNSVRGSYQLTPV